MTSTTLLTSEVLHEAANLIEFHGLGFGTKTWSVDGGGDGICTEGAIAAAAGITIVQVDGTLAPDWAEKQACPAFRAVHEYLGLAEARELWHWNDEFDYTLVQHIRTASEVIETLRATAVIEAAKEWAASDLADALDVAPVGVRA